MTDSAATREPTVSYHARYSPNSPAACLMCSADDLTTTEGAIPEHTRVGAELNDEETAQLCWGAGHTRRQDDGRDALRRYAICHFAATNAELTKARAEALAALQNPQREAGGITRKEMTALIHWQVLTKLWRNFAIHGRWDYAIKECLRMRVADINSSNPLDRAVVEHRRAAAKAWWNAAHLDFLSEFPNGPSHEQFNNMLMGV